MPAKEVALKYLVRSDTALSVTPSTPEGQPADEQGEFEHRPVTIHDGRLCESSLDREGFMLVRQAPAIRDFYDDDAVTQQYEESVRTLVMDATRAARVTVFDHTRRAAAATTRAARRVREPASTIHNDYDAESGLTRLYDLFPDETRRLAGKRFAIVNVWRSINGPVENFPLALCDASTVEPQDLISVKRVARDRVGAIQMLTYNPAHRWVVFEAMQPDEALLFKVFDSAKAGVARFTPHTSFDDPGALSGARDRESIESRCFVFYQ